MPAVEVATEIAGSDLRLYFSGIDEKDAAMRMASYLALEFMLAEPLDRLRVSRLEGED